MLRPRGVFVRKMRSLLGPFRRVRQLIGTRRTNEKKPTENGRMSKLIVTFNDVSIVELKKGKQQPLSALYRPKPPRLHFQLRFKLSDHFRNVRRLDDQMIYCSNKIRVLPRVSRNRSRPSRPYIKSVDIVPGLARRVSGSMKQPAPYRIFILGSFILADETEIHGPNTRTWRSGASSDFETGRGPGRRVIRDGYREDSARRSHLTGKDAWTMIDASMACFQDAGRVWSSRTFDQRSPTLHRKNHTSDF
jgi:hypothetical protein